MNSKKSGRRRFLKEGAVLAGLAVGGIRSASGQTPGSEKSEGSHEPFLPYGERSHFEKAERYLRKTNSEYRFRNSRNTPLQDQIGSITPSGLHFAWSHGYETPDIDPRQHRLLIHGMVDRPLSFTLEELKRLPSVCRIHFVECGGNSGVRHWRQLRDGLMPNAPTIVSLNGQNSCSEWTGVPLSLLLQEAGVQKGASWIVGEGAEHGKHAKSIPLSKAMHDCLVVYGQNGEAVRPEQGYPLRLLVPGFEGVNNVKWLRRIKVGNEPFMTRVDYAYSRTNSENKTLLFQSEMGPKSLITFPSDAHRLPSRGFYEITGLAWSGAGAIRRVEVSTDGGRTWKDAQLQNPVHRIAHTRFGLAWNWDGEETVLQSRCTDELGQVQPSLAEKGKIWGVKPGSWLSQPNSAHFNAIQPWKVTRDGSVHNAMEIAMEI